MELHAYVHHREPSRPKTIVCGTVQRVRGDAPRNSAPNQNLFRHTAVSERSFGTCSRIQWLSRFDVPHASCDKRDDSEQRRRDAGHDEDGWYRHDQR